MQLSSRSLSALCIVVTSLLGFAKDLWDCKVVFGSLMVASRILSPGALINIEDDDSDHTNKVCVAGKSRARRKRKKKKEYC